MKLLIQEDLIGKYPRDQSSTIEDDQDSLDMWEEVIDLCKKCKIYYTITHTPEETIFKIWTQKCTLDEFVMNDVFYNVLDLVDYNMEYGCVGGKGCDFSIVLKAKKEFSVKAIVSPIAKTKPKCSVCGTTENVRWMGGHQPYLCDSVDCIPF